MVRGATHILGFNDGRIAFIWTKRIRIDARVRLHGSGPELVYIGELLQMIPAPANVAQRENANALKILLSRQVPSPGLGARIFKRMRREGKWCGIGADAARIVDT